MSTSCIVILTGKRNAGKTTVCRRTIALARAQGYDCCGILTLKRPNRNSNDVLGVLDVQSGVIRRLSVKPSANAAVVQGRFLFSPKTIRWGNKVLERVHGCQLLTVDELGPLEIERGGGWQQALDLLHKRKFDLALIVVRPELVDQAKAKLPVNATTILTVNEENRNQLPEKLVAMLEGPE